MGGSVSTGVDNDDLIDNLKDAGNIKTVQTERIMRLVDRASYLLPDSRMHAYRDGAWKDGYLHLSAPCIYSEVMEALQLEKGQAFLNVGSGTGYLSTMVGLAIGGNGINHGVEYHESTVKYATEHLQTFMKESIALRYLDFAVPKFEVGNGRSIYMSDASHRYDRIYIGAACDDMQDVKHFAALLKVGGLLVTPMDSNLLRVKRTAESPSALAVETMMACSFTSLLPAAGNETPIFLPPTDVRTPQTLKLKCRQVILAALRERILDDQPDLFMPRYNHRHQHEQRTGRRVVFPLILAQNHDNDEPHLVLGNPVQSVDNGNDAPASGDLPAVAPAVPNHVEPVDEYNEDDDEEDGGEEEDGNGDLVRALASYVMDQLAHDNNDGNGPSTSTSQGEIQGSIEFTEYLDNEEGQQGSSSITIIDRRASFSKRRLSSSQSSSSRVQSKRRTGSTLTAAADLSRTVSTAVSTGDEDEERDTDNEESTPEQNLTPPSAFVMEQQIVDAIRSLKLAPTLARFLNLDRVL